MRIFKGIGVFFSITLVSSALFAKPFSILTVSDIHLNTVMQHRMQIDPKGYDKKNDLDKHTFLSLVQLIKSHLGHAGLPKAPDLVLYLGDAVGHTDLMHGSRQPYVVHSIASIDHMLLNLFPKTPVVIVMGNNDSYERDYGRYFFDGVSPFTIAKTVGFKNGFLSTGVYCAKDDKSVYPCLLGQNEKYGFFSLKLKPTLVLLGVNSVMFSVKHHAKKAVIQAQLDFIQSTLKQAQQEKESVVIAMHIPVGSNTYNGHPFWQSGPEQAFLKLLLSYQDVVRGVLVGHTHMDELKVLNLKGKLLGEYYTAALSTSHGNSPSLRRYDLKENQGQWYLNNYETYQIHKKNKQLMLTPFYRFSKQYCGHHSVVDINQCLGAITFKEIWPQYTVGNFNYPIAKLHDQGAYYLPVK